MVRKHEAETAKNDARKEMLKYGIRITDSEFESMDVADFGLGDFKTEGGQMVTFFCTKSVSVKVIYLYPGQTLPQHWHLSRNYGKEETIRIAGGTLYLCCEGEDTLQYAKIPDIHKQYYTCRNERVMYPADQITLVPGMKHWFQAGPEGTVLYSFSNCAIDALDPFENPDIVRATVYTED